MNRPGQPSYTRAAIAALVEAHAEERDWSGWLADVLAHVAATVGGSETLVSGRSGSWESAAVRQILEGTLGPDDETIMFYTPPGGRDGT